MTDDTNKTNIRTAAFGNKHTPKQLLLDALNHADDMKICVVVQLDKDDYVLTSWSDGSSLKRMGMMQIAALRMMDATQEEYDDE